MKNALLFVAKLFAAFYCGHSAFFQTSSRKPRK